MGTHQSIVTLTTLIVPHHITMGEPTNELFAKLQHREAVNQGTETPQQKERVSRNVYLEFTEFTRKQIKDLEKKFKKFCSPDTQIIGLTELKFMMEKLGAPQTHLGLKAIIKAVDEDLDNALTFREFLLIFRKLAAGDLADRDEDDGLLQLAKLVSIDVGEIGVGGAKNFFEAKIKMSNQTNKFEEEIKKEQEENKTKMEEKRARQEEFKKMQSNF